ncbi:MAG: thioredoxin-dependent thiol peroxidase [Lachnospiraceae bacterium]
MLLEPGTKAPDFTLQDKDGKEVSLSDFLGKKVVLYFYPKDGTSGCTTQACAFASAYPQYEERGIPVIGISGDSMESHKQFAASHHLPFLLLSDPEHKVLQAYGVWQEKQSNGNTVMGTVRTTYIIDETGRIEKVMANVNPDTNAAEILEYLDAEIA